MSLSNMLLEEKSAAVISTYGIRSIFSLSEPVLVRFILSGSFWGFRGFVRGLRVFVAYMSGSVGRRLSRQGGLTVPLSLCSVTRRYIGCGQRFKCW